MCPLREEITGLIFPQLNQLVVLSYKMELMRRGRGESAVMTVGLKRSMHCRCSHSCIVGLALAA